MERLVRDSLQDLVIRATDCSQAVPGSREQHDMEYDAVEKLKEIAEAIHNHPLAVNRRVDKRYDFRAVEEVVQQLCSARSSMDFPSLINFLLGMKYQARTRMGKPVLFGVHARAFDDNCLLDVDHRWGMGKALQREILSFSGFVDWILFELEADVSMWCRRDTNYVAPHCSILDLSQSQIFRVISELRKQEFVISPRGPRFRDWLAGRVTKDQASFTEQCCLLLKNIFSRFRDWLKSQQTTSSWIERQDLISAWNAHHDHPHFWAGVWHSVFRSDRHSMNTESSDSTGPDRMLSNLIDVYHRDVIVIKMEAIELVNAITHPNFCTSWDDLDTLFVVESCIDVDEDCYLWFRDCMRVVTSREKEFATYFLLFDDALGPKLPPPDESPEQRRKLYKPFRLGLAPDGFWRVAQTFEVSGKTPEEVVEIIENKLVSIDRLSILSPLDFIDNTADPMDHNILANNLTLDLLTHLKLLSLFGTPNYFQLFFQSKSREPLLKHLKESISQDDFLNVLIQRLPSEDEGDIVPHVDHIKPIAVHEELMAGGLKWTENPNAPVKCLQAWQALLRKTDFGKGWVGLPCIQASTFLEALGEPGGKYRNGWMRLGCFQYEQNVENMELSQSEAFEAFIRGIGFCDERTVLIPVCGVLKIDEVISASNMIESFRWTKVIPRKMPRSRANTRPPKRPKLRND